MSSPFDAWAGAQSFIESWLDQDEVEKERANDELEAALDRREQEQVMQLRQAGEQRTEALFPSKLQGAEQELALGALDLQAATRKSNVQAVIDQKYQETYGQDVTQEVAQALIEQGGEQLLDQLQKTQLKLRTPEKTATKEAGALEAQIGEQRADIAGGGPGARGRTTAIQAGGAESEARFGAAVSGLKAEGEFAREVFETERQLNLLEPVERLATIEARLAQAQKDRLAAAGTPAGKEEQTRQAYINIYGNDQQYWEDKVTKFRIESGVQLDLSEIKQGLDSTLTTIARLQSPETTDTMAQLMMQTLMQNNPKMFGSLGAEGQEGKTVEEILAPLQGLFNYYDRQHQRLTGESYTSIASRPAVFTARDLDATIGSMALKPGAQPLSFSTAKASERIQEYIINLANSADPESWTRGHRLAKAKFTQRWTEQDWQQALKIIEAMKSEHQAAFTDKAQSITPTGTQVPGTTELELKASDRATLDKKILDQMEAMLGPKR